MNPIYVIRFFLEWGGGALWCGNQAAYAEFDVGNIEDQLPLSAQTRARIDELTAWHDTSLNWDYPPDPGPWRQAECDQFNAEAHALHVIIQQELGPQFEVQYDHPLLCEDPDLDRYLADPKGFKRNS